MSKPLFIDWDNSGGIDPADIGTSYALAGEGGQADDDAGREADDDAEAEREAESQLGSASASGCLSALAIMAIAPIVVAVAMFVI